MGSTKSLGDFVAALPEEQAQVVEIDLAEFPGELPERMVFTFRHPTAAQLFQAGKAGKKLSVQFLEMTDEMGAICATMGIAHVSPPAEKSALLYAKIATMNSSLFMWLMRRFMDAFPDLSDLEAKIDEAKKQFEMEI